MSQATLARDHAPTAPASDRRPGRRRALRGDRPGDAARGARPDDPGHRAAVDRRATSGASPTSPGSSPPTSSPPRRRRPLWGKLGDRHGRKLLLEIALAVFVAASALCGAAQDIAQLIVAAPRAGRGRRRPDDAGHGHGRRPRLAARARPLPGLHRRHVRRRDHRRAAARRPAGRPRELALGVLVNLPIGLLALAGLHLRLPAPEAARAPTGRSTSRARRCSPAPRAR